MSRFKLDNRTLQLLNAQVNLSETFSHTIRSTPLREALPFRLKVERNSVEAVFTVELCSERHSLTLPNDKKMHLKLADFIEEIANGPIDPTNTVDQVSMLHANRDFARFDANHRQQVLALVRNGGAISLDMGFDLPINVAIHRTRTRTGLTTIMSIGTKRPRTKCFTVCGTEAEMYEKVVESIQHLASVATPAAHAA